METPKRYLLLACAVLQRESYACAARARHTIDVQIMEQGLHDIGQRKMSGQLQVAIDQADTEKYDAILLGYGLCSHGIQGLHAPIPLVVPRAHDCITLFMGSKERYQKYFDQNPGTYFLTVGWIEQTPDNALGSQQSLESRREMQYRTYVEKYGEDNAKYLMETLGDGLQHYSKLTYIDTEVDDGGHSQSQARIEAEQRGWTFEHMQGNLGLMQRLVDGEWDEESFLMVPPGKSIQLDYGSGIIKAE